MVWVPRVAGVRVALPRFTRPAVVLARLTRVPAWMTRPAEARSRPAERPGLTEPGAFPAVADHTPLTEHSVAES
ncbi:hypothetical protein [Amycolatopsis circi]|uniref:hypothetical protein n=1 Tax=Amycolatopsis circi TaxID=871959 RepID=UPI001FCA4233|nr:hypothetical protein [Amycolatopsis circi]